MDEIKIVLEFAKTYGLSGLIVMVLLWDKYIKPYRKKNSGEWVSYKDVHQLAEQVKKMENRLETRLQKQSEEDIKINSMEKDIQFQGEEIREAKGDVKDIFRILSEIKNMLITMKEK